MTNSPPSFRRLTPIIFLATLVLVPAPSWHTAGFSQMLLIQGLADRIVSDVAKTAHQVSIFLHNVRPEAALEQSSAARTPAIVVVDREPTQQLHQPGKAGVIGRCRQQVSLVGHEHPAMHCYLMTLCTLRRDAFYQTQVYSAPEL